MKILEKSVEFEWDKGNVDKNKVKHGVENKEAEKAFLGKDKFIFKDKLHSKKEERFRIFGKTNKGRELLVVFTIRSKKIRIISARDMSRREVKFYEKKISTTKV